MRPARGTSHVPASGELACLRPAAYALRQSLERDRGLSCRTLHIHALPAPSGKTDPRIEAAWSSSLILAWFDSKISNGLIEGINSLVQAAKAKARGYRNSETLKAMTYLIAGKLDLKLPT